MLRSLAIRYQHLSGEVEDATVQLHDILQSYTPMLQELTGVGADVAAQLLITFGDHQDRIGNEARFAALTHVALILASAAKTSRHRLSRGGDGKPTARRTTSS